ncbi:MAG: peptide chain release factor N(5)-glutamine methyltransferase [Christensenellaceae bacterium]
MNKIASIYQKTKERLNAFGRPEFEAEARALLAYVFNCDFSQLLLRFLDEQEEPPMLEQLLCKIDENKEVPLAYVIHQKYFYGRSFYVDERVLIPRYDTETVVQAAVELAKQKHYQTALDLCCGSGCMGITLFLESEIEKLCLADVSGEALEVAKKNAQVYIKNVELIQTDLFESIHEKVDMIVTNPPYISALEYAQLDIQVRAFEPQNALLAQCEGYEFYEKIIAQAMDYLNDGGTIVLEIGNTQQNRVFDLLKSAGFDKIRSGFDMANRPRFLTGEKYVR